MRQRDLFRKALTLSALKREAVKFASSPLRMSGTAGNTNGKSVGTAVEKGLKAQLRERYYFEEGKPNEGVDLQNVEGLDVDIKATCVKQPQSTASKATAPNADKNGLPYALLVFLYDYRGGEIVFLRPLFIPPEEASEGRAIHFIPVGQWYFKYPKSKLERYRL